MAYAKGSTVVLDTWRVEMMFVSEDVCVGGRGGDGTGDNLIQLEGVPKGEKFSF